MKILACYRVVDLPNPNPLAVKSTCKKCGEPIYVMPQNIALPLDKVCHQCTEAMLNVGDEVIIAPAALFPNDRRN